MLSNVWLFPGQGSQYTQMGRHIWRDNLAAQVLSMAESISELPLRAVMEQGPEFALRRPDYLEPCIVAFQLSCVLMLRRNGVQPDAVAGYSLGEIGALYCAGSLSLVDALTLASARGKLLARNAERGEWSSRAIHFKDEPGSHPIKADDNIFIAAYNSSRDFTLTGQASHMLLAENALLKSGVSVSPVMIDGPWHSPLAADSALETASLLRSMEIRKPLLPVCLGTSGVFQSDMESLRASLSRQIESPVLWSTTLDTLWNAGARSTLEIGPGRVLTSFVRTHWAQRQYQCRFLERQGSRPFDFAELRGEKAFRVQAAEGKEQSWTKSA